MATLSVSITAPRDHEEVGADVPVAGFVQLLSPGDFFDRTNVTVQFGEHGPIMEATTTDGIHQQRFPWHCTGTVPSNAYFVPNSSFYPDGSLARS
jgi:hypothetical protein